MFKVNNKDNSIVNFEYITAGWIVADFFSSATLHDLLVQSQQWQHQNDAWNLFKVNNSNNNKSRKHYNDVINVLLSNVLLILN